MRPVRANSATTRSAHRRADEVLAAAASGSGKPSLLRVASAAPSSVDRVSSAASTTGVGMGGRDRDGWDGDGGEGGMWW